MKVGVPANYRLTASDPYHTKNCPPGTDPKPDGYHNAGRYEPTYPLSQALPLSSNTYFVGMEDQLFGCNLAPIVDTAVSLGMNYLNDPRVPTTRSTARSRRPPSRTTRRPSPSASAPPRCSS